MHTHELVHTCVSKRRDGLGTGAAIKVGREDRMFNNVSTFPMVQYLVLKASFYESFKYSFYGEWSLGDVRDLELLLKARP